MQVGDDCVCRCSREIAIRCKGTEMGNVGDFKGVGLARQGAGPRPVVGPLHAPGEPAHTGVFELKAKW